MTSTILQEIKPLAHIQIIFSDKKKLANHLADFINKGLDLGQLCYVGTTEIDTIVFDEFTKQIHNFDENLNNGNLIFSILEPYKKQVIEGDLSPFESLTKILASKVANRKDKYIRLIGDLASFLMYDGKYEQYQRLEEWCHSRPFDGCIVCPFDCSKLDQTKESLMKSLHDETIHC